MVNPNPKWAVDSNQYVKRPRAYTGADESTTALTPPALGDARMLDATHVSWDRDAVPWHLISRSDTDRARARLRAQLPELVWNAAALEGNTYTLPEVRTLLEGVTVGGKPLEDAQQILALTEAFNELDRMVGDGSFALTKTASDRLHARLARHEAIEAGGFRREGATTGGGHVRLSDGTRVEGVDAGPGGAALRERFNTLTNFVDECEDPREAALVYFASAARTQFYFDGNKRTARLMMAGHLMASGFDAVSVPAARRLEFNVALDTLFQRDDATPVMALLATCTID
jgi:Fic family protein